MGLYVIADFFVRCDQRSLTDENHFLPCYSIILRTSRLPAWFPIASVQVFEIHGIIEYRRFKVSKSASGPGQIDPNQLLISIDGLRKLDVILVNQLELLAICDNGSEVYVVINMSRSKMIYILTSSRSYY